jgi:hypothetical protein
MNGMVPPACAKINRMSEQRCAVPVSIRLAIGARRVSGELNQMVRYLLHQVAAAVRAGRMHIHHSIAAVELIHHGCEGAVAEPLLVHAGHEADAVGLQYVECILDLGEAAVDVGQRQGSEHTEPAGEIPGDGCRVFIALTRKRTRRGIVAEPHAGRRDRRHCRGYASTAHLLQRFRRRPFDQCVLASLPRGDLGNQRRRSMMMVNVDPERHGGQRQR